MQIVLIVLLSIVSAMVYGIIHDQITARICVEYFTIGHPPVFGIDSPTLLGLGWGVIATWWVGLILGVPLALVSRLGTRPKRTAASLVCPIGVLLLVMAVSAALAGCIGRLLAGNGMVWLDEPMASMVPKEKHVAFLVDLWTHLASYLVGFVGGIVLMIWVWISRGRAQRAAAHLPVAADRL
jgi:hypothetical protein